MSFREIFGLVIACAGVAVLPFGWYTSRLLWIVSFVLVVIGFVLYFTSRVAKAETELRALAEPHPPGIRPTAPANPHAYSSSRDDAPGDAGGADGD
jgi:hypothetical protein